MIRQVRHVINYDCPHYVSDYIHRSGRTGRIGTHGDCLVSTLVSFKPDVRMLQDLEMALRLNKPIDSVDANIKQQLNNFFNEKLTKGRKRRKY
jgi:superfamily II DNA/RNA helicase